MDHCTGGTDAAPVRFVERHTINARGEVVAALAVDAGVCAASSTRCVADESAPGAACVFEPFGADCRRGWGRA